MYVEVIRRCVFIECIAALAGGVWLLEQPLPSTLLGLLLMIQAALGFCLLKPSEEHHVPKSITYAVSLALLLLGVALMVTSLTIMTTPPELRPPFELSVIYWAASIFCFLLAAYLTASCMPLKGRLFSRTEIAIGIAFIACALIIRAWGLLTRSPVAIEDELDIFGELVSLFRGYRPNPWLTTPLGFSWLINWIIYLLHPLFTPILDTYAFAKLLGAFAASLSIGAWYGVMRILTTRRVAVAGAAMLTFASWHWVNSRFLYVYPFDFGILGVGVLATLWGLEQKNPIAMAVAGIAAALGLILQKIGPLLAPFLVLLCLDYYILASKEVRRSYLKLFGIWSFFLVVSYLPCIITYLNGGWLPRHSTILGSRAELLAPYGVSSIEAFFWIFLDGFYQLHVKAFDHLRHIFRLERPLLDPVQSALFMVGLLASLLQFRRSRAARIGVLGVAVFMIPMVVSFPIDSGSFHGLARRMIGTVYFVTWIAAIGAEVVTARLFRPGQAGTRIAMLCAVSIGFNIYLFFTSYLSVHDRTANWQLKDIGIQKSSILVTTRNLARSGHAVILLADNTSLVHYGAFQDLPNVVLAQSVEKLRALVQERRGAPLFTVIPGETLVTHGQYQSLTTRLADLIPTTSWVATAPEVHDIPTALYSFTFTPR